jgi:hypothetical protein
MDGNASTGSARTAVTADSKLRVMDSLASSRAAMRSAAMSRSTNGLTCSSTSSLAED